MTRQRILALVALVTVAVWVATAVESVAPVYAHVAPSQNENNRYLKVTLLPDRVRVSFTVFFGERPGASERLRMDRDHDGQLAPAESQAFGESVRDDVAGHLRVRVDDVPVPASAWTLADVGLGMPSARGGSFSIDLLAYLPTRGAGAHALAIDDGWNVPNPGESEVRIETSPGVRVVAAHRVADPTGMLQLRYAFTGNPPPDGSRAIRVDWLVDDSAAAQAAAETAAPPAPAPRSHRLLWLALAVCGVGAIALAWLARRR
jgi:hypothetical protein